MREPVRWRGVWRSGCRCPRGAACAAARRRRRLRSRTGRSRQRVEALLAQMTLEEKVGQLTQIAGGLFPGAKPEEALRKGGAGSILWLNDTKKFNELQKVAVEESRLKIPVLFGLDVIHGYRTIFPVPLAMAASWDPSVHERAAAVAAREARAAGIHWTFAPMLDIARDARWGRIVEGAGEDPYLGAAMAAAQVRGFQGPYLGAPERVLACAKHFAAYGAAEGGRDYDPVYVSEGQLRNVYFPPFQAAVEAGVGAFMSAYMDLNDVPAGGNRWLLRDVLRREWGFPGFVVSDAMGVGNLVTRASPGTARTPPGAPSPPASTWRWRAALPASTSPRLVKEGAVPRRRSTTPCAASSRSRCAWASSRSPTPTRRASPPSSPTRSTAPEARLAAQRSMVLLRNEKKLLPLAKTVTSVAVIGPLADSKADTEGSWMVFGHVPAAVTVLEGLRAKLPAREDRLRARAGDPAPGPVLLRRLHAGPEEAAQTPEEAEAAFQQAVETARGADVVIAVMGELAEHERRGRLARLARPAGPPGGAAEGRGRPRQARRARAPERPAARASTGRPRTCPRSSRRGSRARRAGTPWPTCSSAT